MDGRTGRGCRAGPASQWRDREISLAHHHVAGLNRQAQTGCGDLRKDRIAAGADIVGGKLDIGAASSLHPHPGVRRQNVGWIGRRGAAVTHQPVAVGHAADL